MLPLQQALEVKESVINFIKASYNFKDARLNEAFYRFINDPRQGLFKGPYVSLKTPFVSATGSEDIPLTIRPDFSPYRHQLEAFRRLTTKGGHTPQPTLLTTGTGSGKTECFLYPILDYCYERNKYEHKEGIKVIIMYPMNALATDQAKRLAEAIYNDKRLRGRITAGLFIGENTKNKTKHTKSMGPTNIIEDRDTIVRTAPDIVLTNFKMLDYALMQQRYMDLWKGNIGVPLPALKFLVLDELHTYDGAQGTDVANLIRRLKLKINLPEHQLCPVGTSATIGSGDNSKPGLCSYASSVFGEEFDFDSVIEEHRVPVDDFCTGMLSPLPTIEDLRQCIMKKTDTSASYTTRLWQRWAPSSQGDPVRIGEALRKMQIVHDILQVTDKGCTHIDDLSEDLRSTNGQFRTLHRTNPGLCDTVLQSVLALISMAKAPGGKFPFLYLQVQLWQRELSGILRYVQAEPEFTWRGDITQDDRVALPMYFCRDCGASGWYSYKTQTDNGFSADVRKIGRAIISHDQHLVLLNISNDKHKPIAEYAATTAETCNVVKSDLSIVRNTAPDTLRLIAITKVASTNHEFVPDCPECAGGNDLAVVGYRTATLSSVAISQVLSSDWDNKTDNQRKILVFSNSVQDAAHLAGFYEARAFRFMFRHALQEYLDQQQSPLSLAALQTGFKEYWKAKLPGEYYYYQFLPADIAKDVDLSKDFRRGDDFTEDFRKEFDVRVDWEICAEFSMNARIGRTLEKTGSSGTFFRLSDIESVFAAIEPWLRENNLAYIADSKDTFVHFVNGVLHRIRIGGGVDHPFVEKYREGNQRWHELNWKYDRGSHFLNPKYAMKSRLPKFIITEQASPSYGRDSTFYNRTENWYSRYFEKCFVLSANQALVTSYQELKNDFYRELFKVFEALGIMNKSSGTLGNYAISPEFLMVESGVKSIKCDTCQSVLNVGVSDEVSEGTKCLEHTCAGAYSEVQPAYLDYYQSIYKRKISPRQYAHEHTGLLERKKRESIETSFKVHSRFNDYNVLVATSTLELGIDIGDLDSMGNTSIPPTTSNYLQRIGRAGRKSGSALVLNYAHGNSSHDLYYFQDPLSMMNGEIKSPGCFLEAKDILRRHFFAYCIDSWTSSSPANKIPQELKYLSLKEETLSDPDFFINQIVSFAKANEAQLFDAFVKLYPKTDRMKDVLGALYNSIQNETLFLRIKSEFTKLISQIRALTEQIKELQAAIDAKGDNDPEKEQLKRTRKGFISRRKSIEEQLTVEFMTDAGLLPNYAFPETGVKLSATIFSDNVPGDDDERNSINIEIVRPASSGIRDLAPGNEFYTQKFRLPITGINTFDWGDNLKSVRFCSNCDSIAEEGTPDYSLATCPKCGDASWGANTHRYLHYTGATSFVMHRREATLDDRNDERATESYQTIKHYKFNQTGAVQSYGLVKIPFGLEFCKDVDIYEANYGLQNEQSSHIQINQIDTIPENGFVTCKYCGKSSPWLQQKAEDYHERFCHYRNIGFNSAHPDRTVFEQLYLMRKMKTEAIKVLLPVMDGQEVNVQLFKAGIELGLRNFYEGTPDHLRVDTYREFNRRTSTFDSYLVIYDTIPGGTGYLSQIINPEQFTKLLRVVYEQLHDCKCQEEGKDGCYHCILTYENQYHREGLSRAAAEELFATLLDKADEWEPIDGPIGTLTNDGALEDSELEKRFVRSLKHYAENHHWGFEKKEDMNSYYYELHVKHNVFGSDLLYIIHPQYSLGTANGVRHITVPDFQFICKQASFNGVPVAADDLPQWAVYLDGYTYHASKSNMRFYSDYAKREAIRESGKMFSWALSWEDLELFDQEEALGKSDELYMDSPVYAEYFPNVFHQYKTSMDRLLALLADPRPSTFMKKIHNYIACGMVSNDNLAVPEDVGKAAIEDATTKYTENVTDEIRESENFYAKSSIIQPSSFYSGSAWFNIGNEESVVFHISLVPDLTELDRAEWAHFWRVYDILQFFTTVNEQPPAVAHTPSAQDFSSVYPGLENVIADLLANDIPFDPDGGYTLQDEDGVIIAEADLGFAEKKVVFGPVDNDSEQSFIEHGYRIMSADDYDINALK